ncbi:MAG: hypothetical protein KF845_11355 [Cyclobacteriaceae bacterium]|nr:hypothetical protein [Cyclobacteriaceae bacterium]
MNRFLIISFFFLTEIFVFGQSLDERASLLDIAPGIYLTFKDFPNNEPVSVEAIETHLDYRSRDFFWNLYKEGKIVYTLSDEKYEIDSRRIWGYFDGQSLYLNKLIFPYGWSEGREKLDYPFARVFKLGTISLIYYIRNYMPELYTTLPSMYSVATPQSRPMKFLLDMRDGKRYKATLKNFEHLIKDDEELWIEYKASKDDKDIKLYLFLERYNKRNPFRHGY